MAMLIRRLVREHSPALSQAGPDIIWRRPEKFCLRQSGGLERPFSYEQQNEFELTLMLGLEIGIGHGYLYNSRYLDLLGSGYTSFTLAYAYKHMAPTAYNVTRSLAGNIVA